MLKRSVPKEVSVALFSDRLSQFATIGAAQIRRAKVARSPATVSVVSSSATSVEEVEGDE